VMQVRLFLDRVRGAIDVVYREILKFGAVGAVAFVVDLGVFNLLRIGLLPGMEGPLAHKPLTAKTISVAAATMVAWLGNRYWTFRHRRRSAAHHEFALFVLMNVGGLVIALACLAVSHYVLGLRSALADNIAGNVIGLGLGTLFRFWAYRTLVFTELRGPGLTRPTHPGPSLTGTAQEGPVLPEAADPEPGVPELMQPLLVGRAEPEQQPAQHGEHHPSR
jgi:putative flippase GtrA